MPGTRRFACTAPDFSWLRFDVLDARGIVRCSSEPQSVGTDQSDYPEVIAARNSGQASRGEYAWGLFSGVPGLAMATVWHGPNGESGVVSGVARLDPFVQTLQTLLPRGYAAIVADRGGRVAGRGAGRGGCDRSRIAAFAGAARVVAGTWPGGGPLERRIGAACRLRTRRRVPAAGGVPCRGVRQADVMADVWAFAYSAGLAPAVLPPWEFPAGLVGRRTLHPPPARQPRRSRAALA